MSLSVPWRITADTGGTFTDCHAMSPDGAEHRIKVLSSGNLRATILAADHAHRTIVISESWNQTGNFFQDFTIRLLDGVPQWQSKILASWNHELGVELKVLDGLPDVDLPSKLIEVTSGEAAPVLGARLITHTPLDAEFPPLHFRLATTRATNALLERKGTSLAFFITAGLGDLLKIGDQRRKHLFALQHESRETHYEEVVEVSERISASGEILIPLDEKTILQNAKALIEQGITHAAVALLHSDIQPAHELQMRQLLLQAGMRHVSLSHELAPFIKILPRAQSAIANAYLTGPVEQFISDVATPISQSSTLHLMTSAAALEPATTIRPKDLLLSGPAAGVLGALNAALLLGHENLITFDMGGTSTDVARLDGVVNYRFQQHVGSITLLGPTVAIETVAAGGGSICTWTPSGLTVGPHSAGSEPGPACYGKGGPLTVTDVNLLLGRFDPSRAPIPLQKDAAESRLEELRDTVEQQSGRKLTSQQLLEELLAIANQHMADAIRKISVLEGYDPTNYALLAFGGAGPQHACDLADALGIHTILIPHHAGILSAVGLQQATPERFAESQVLKPLEESLPDLPLLLSDLGHQAAKQLLDITHNDETPHIRYLAEVRLFGQDSSLQIPFNDPASLPGDFRKRYLKLFGYDPPVSKTIELVSLRVVAKAPDFYCLQEPDDPVETLSGPNLVQDAFSTLVIAEGWTAARHEHLGWILKKQRRSANTISQTSTSSIDLLRHRLHGIVDDMGALLRRTALSTNIRERLDFSCALLTPDGTLLTSAPHIPVHLGALGVCVRETFKRFTTRPGDTFITNHPAFGGSHLPDVTLITPVFDPESNDLLGVVANRAHHAEIGGISPGSMPANATRLAEEGVIIAPDYLMKQGESQFDLIRELLQNAAYPTRNIDDNIADLHAQLAANLQGAERLLELSKTLPDLISQMNQILAESRRVMQQFLPQLGSGDATELLDDGNQICVNISIIPSAEDSSSRKIHIDFSGTSAQHEGNLNATPAIVHSAVLYVLRLVLQQDLPLNEGLLTDVEIQLPSRSLLNPQFPDHTDQLPAVVGGNVEISQRVVDVLLKALGVQACSQGTMNNFLFGNERYGYYETVCGGSGAGPGYHGASALHTHMTNTAITDPEVLERRYPVRLHRFAIRQHSGGKGQWNGGDGVIREIEYLEPLTVSILSQHRLTKPYGMEGGEAGMPGKQTLLRSHQSPQTLPPSITLQVEPHDRIILETPGGGGWGTPKALHPLL